MCPLVLVYKERGMIHIETGSSNVYADIGTPKTNDMLIKARLAARIGQDIQSRGLTQSQAAALLGHRVQIVINEQMIKPIPVEVVFA